MSFLNLLCVLCSAYGIAYGIFQFITYPLRARPPSSRPTGQVQYDATSGTVINNLTKYTEQRISALLDSDLLRCCGKQWLALLKAGGLLVQCGTGGTEDVLTLTPVIGSRGLGCRHVAAGLAHSACVTLQGDVYTWGWNHCGQVLPVSCSVGEEVNNDKQSVSRAQDFS